jgi:hypothetical protein
MTSRFKKLLSAVCCLTLFGFTQIGCQKNEAIQGSNDQKLLAATNLALRADYAYMRKLAAANGGAVKLDLSDDTQYRFLQARVAASGKTPERYPQFFAMLKKMRERHLAQKKGQEFSIQTLQPHDHIVGDFTVLPGGVTFEATSFFTIQGGADYSFVDVVVWDELGAQQVSDYGWGEVYDDGRKLKARATGPLPFNSDGVFYVDSVSMVSENGLEDTYYVAEDVKTPPGGSMYHPTDTNKDGIVTICLDRNYGDCDYPMVGYRQVQIPLKGAVTFAFEVAEILNTNKTYVKLVEEKGGPREMTFGPFYNWLKINPADRRQVTWDVPQSNGVFNGILFQPYEDVDFFLSIDVKLKRPSPGGLPTTNASAKISSVATATSPGMPNARKIQIVYSCLAEGTEIRMADGKTVKIENITKGSKVLTNDSGLALGVADLSVGIERIPMVRIEDDAGHNLLLTTSHPVVTPDRGVVWAEELSVGNKVFTQSGITTLVKAEREMFRGTVHNLKLDTTGLPEREFAKGSTMFANGFRVGDLAMQKAYEFKNSEDYRANVLARLPAQWRADYQRSQKDGTLLTQR